MQRIACLLRDQFMCFHAHHDIRALDADYKIIIVAFLNHTHLIKCRFYNALCGHTTVFFNERFLQRAGIHTHTDWYIPFLCDLHNLLQILLTTDIARVDADLICTILHRQYRQTIIEMNVCHDRNVNLFLDLAKRLRCRLGICCRTDNLTACLLQFKNLCYRCSHIGCLCVRHRLNRNRITTTDYYTADIDHPRCISVRKFFLRSISHSSFPTFSSNYKISFHTTKYHSYPE